MVNINNFSLTGRLVGDPNIKVVQDQYVYADFTVATQRTWKSRNADSYETDFIPVKCSGPSAKFAEKYLSKGTKVEIEGAVEQNKWTDKEGKKNSRLYVNVRSIRFAESRKMSESAPKAQSSAPASNDNFMDIPTDEGFSEELPFN